ncbi:putative endonuclease [Tenacibaculum skagerrakense]|uniref:Putative endonuclease n=1 Tax=Tenacibaculum skagerrakense TaxID=186571 RepID=A0A4R2P1X9_9FLAO|nr:GIY-YIG nuclease family protein [Tenacibaculum skagerrakense]TCP28537.1 putative endonuclease [Tenacibaculum skagerrakense]
MYFLYIIYSKTLNKYYVGVTHDLKSRIEKHNQHCYSKAYTKAAFDWEYKLQMEYSKDEALYLEKFIKKMKSKKFIEKVINNTRILDNIIEKR